MIPVFQTVLADPSRADGHSAEGVAGNCYQAALASVLELPLEQVPHFAQDGERWQETSEAWLTERGVIRAFYVDEHLAALGYPLYVEPGTDFWGTPADFLIGALGAGPSPRGPWRHVVVLDPDTGDMLHDPHPSGAGVLEVDEVELLIAAQLTFPDSVRYRLRRGGPPTGTRNERTPT